MLFLLVVSAQAHSVSLSLLSVLCVRGLRTGGFFSHFVPANILYVVTLSERAQSETPFSPRLVREAQSLNMKSIPPL